MLWKFADQFRLRITPRSPLDAFLTAEDLDELLEARRAISSLTSEDISRIQSVIHAWNDRQAVANLLFHPGLIPDDLRSKALDRALHSDDVPYFVLAATVGLGGVSLNEVPAEERAAWVRALLGHVQSTSKAVAGRASNQLYYWAKDAHTTDILPELLSRYPVADEGANENIVAAVLTRFGDLPAQEFVERLTELRVRASARIALERTHEEYQKLRLEDEFRADLMKAPALAYIPNLSEF